MPLIIKIPKNSEIEILGVTIKAERSCAFSINDQKYTFIKETDQAPRRIVKAEASE